MAEKAMKALWYLAGADLWVHSVQRLVIEFPAKSTLGDITNLIELGGLLDRFCIPTRYPNGLPDLTPGQVYCGKNAEQGLQAAKVFIELSRRALDRSRSAGTSGGESSSDRNGLDALVDVRFDIGSLLRSDDRSYGREGSRPANAGSVRGKFPADSRRRIRAAMKVPVTEMGWML